MKVFVWLPQGRLGNLIFQYQAIAELSGSAWVLALDSEFFDTFERPRRFLVIPCFKRFRWHLQVLWTALFEGLAKRRWIGIVEPGRNVVIDDITWETLEVHWKQGTLKNIFMVRGFFHTPRYIEPLPRLKHEISQDAERRFAGVSKPDRVAIHMRFGDYRHWVVLGVAGSACLPDSYYVNAVAMVRDTIPKAYFFVLSDEPDRARAILTSAGVSGRIKVVDDGTVQSDFALIASCSHAILSASSFSWWAGALIANPSRLLIAPKYWLGFRRKTWFPPEIRHRHFLYLDPLARCASNQDNGERESARCDH